jgi:hypothetical protein
MNDKKLTPLGNRVVYLVLVGIVVVLSLIVASVLVFDAVVPKAFAFVLIFSGVPLFLNQTGGEEESDMIDGKEYKKYPVMLKDGHYHKALRKGRKNV